MKKILLLSSIFLFSVIGLSAFTAGSALAFDSKSAACAGINDTFGSSCDGKAATDKANNLITTIVNILTVIVGIVAVIMIIIGGFRFITSSGDSASVSGAKKTVIYAIVGLIVVVLAQVIVRFVLHASTATPATTSTSSQTTSKKAPSK